MDIDPVNDPLEKSIVIRRKMKSAKRRILLALLLITLLVMSGCAQEEDNQQDSVSLVIKDMSGAEISLEGQRRGSSL